MTRVLFVSHDVIGPSMAGPGIRYVHLARALARALGADGRVTLAAPDDSSFSTPELVFHRYARRDWLSLRAAALASDVIVAPSDIASDLPQLADCAAAIVIDGYDPLMSEWLALQAHHPLDHQMTWWADRQLQLKLQLWLGDRFICASERQRDWWLGLLENAGRINPLTTAQDRTLRALVDVVPYGLPEAPPQRTGAAIKGVWPGIGINDKVVLWGGGLWSWLDPLTAIRAIDLVRRERVDVRLVFPGTRHPNPMLKDMPTQVAAAQALSNAFGLTDQHVFFGDWIPHAEWPNVLLDSDAAVSLHFDTLETRLAFRSRILDYIWAGLPTVCSAGDATGELVQHFSVGSVTPIGDAVAVAAALLRWLSLPKDPARFLRAQKTLTWDNAVRPLAAFCRTPVPASDRAQARAQFQMHLEGEPLQTIGTLRAERDRLQSLVAAYENGRFVKLMKRLKGHR